MGVTLRTWIWGMTVSHQGGLCHYYCPTAKPSKPPLGPGHLSVVQHGSTCQEKTFFSAGFSTDCSLVSSLHRHHFDVTYRPGFARHQKAARKAGRSQPCLLTPSFLCFIASVPPPLPAPSLPWGILTFFLVYSHSPVPQPLDNLPLLESPTL